MSCCTNTYDLGCHSHCDLLELSDIQWPSTGTFCFVSTFAGNPVSWEQDGIDGENIELSMQLLNEDGESTFYIKDSNGQVLTFDIGGTEYDCFKITAYPAGCGTTDFTTIPVTCSAGIGINCQIPVWDYANQDWIRLDPGDTNEALVINTSGCPEWTSIGVRWLAGEGAPAAGLGENGWYYLDTQGSVYYKAAGVWTQILVFGNGTLTGANNGLHLDGTNVQLGSNPLIEQTSIWQAAFNLLFGGTPEAGKQVEYDSGPDLFKLNAHHGLPAINGAGIRYMMTFDGVPVTGYPLGKPTSWFFVKTSNDTPVGGDYLVSIGFFNAVTFKETFWEVTEDALRGVVLTAGGDETSAYCNDTEGYVFRGKDATGNNHAITAKDVNDVRLFRVRNNGLIDIFGGGTIDPTAGNASDVLTDDGAGNWSMQPPGGGSGITELTGDVTAGPGSGSQAATLANTAVTPGAYTNADITVDAKGRITAAANGSFGGDSLTLDSFTDRVASADGTNNWISHRVVAIPANTIANGDMIISDMMMYRNAATNDTSNYIYLTNQPTIATPTGGNPWLSATPTNMWAILNRIEVVSFATGFKICYAFANAAGQWYRNSDTNVFNPYITGAIPATGASGNAFANLPIDYTQVLYLHWITYQTTPSGARTRGFDAGLVRLFKA